MRIAIVGAGMAGLACAEKLVAAGHEVDLFDKGRRAGGRMSTRRLRTGSGEAAFDHGAQYFTARDPAFQARLAVWREAGLAAPWPAAGDDAWVGAPAMDVLIGSMSAALTVHWSAQVDRISRDAAGWRVDGEGIDDNAFDALVVAIPAEQAAILVRPWNSDMADVAAATPSDPCWTMLAAFAERLPVVADVVRDRGEIAWATRNSAKPGRSSPESWVVQADPSWSRANLERPADEVARDLLGMFQTAISIEAIPTLALVAHRWRYARSGNADTKPLWSAGSRLGLCGDWLLGPRVESAWLSGDRLADAILSA